jgi:hypothetical protein
MRGCYTKKEDILSVSVFFEFLAGVHLSTEKLNFRSQVDLAQFLNFAVLHVVCGAQCCGTRASVYLARVRDSFDLEKCQIR